MKGQGNHIKTHGAISTRRDRIQVRLIGTGTVRVKGPGRAKTKV